MKFQIKPSALAAAIALISSQTMALSGQVRDENGELKPGVEFKLVGTSQSYFSDDNGAFDFAAGDVHELHVKAPGYSHQIIHLDEIGSGPLNIVLKTSALQQIDVVGLPIHASTVESAQPISVLTGEELKNQMAATLGDSLEGQVGVNTNFHGNVASTPIIRGLSGPRVLVTQNSLDVSDVSRVGPDHAVASEVSTAEQVEILRGPATLFFGSGAIGGVVNVVDKRIPSDSDTYGEWSLSHDSVNQQDQAAFNLNTGMEDIGIHLDGFWRQSDDYEIPQGADTGEAANNHDIVYNSDDETLGYTLGSSYLLDQGYLGLSYGKLEREYGIPGHSHGDADSGAIPERVYADVDQDRVQLLSQLNLKDGLLNTINTRIGYTDYVHSEIEAGSVSTTFKNTTSEAKIDLLHRALAQWKGGLVLHFKNSDFSANGEEAFTPDSETQSFALALVEERHFGDFLLQLGTRVEQVSINADQVLVPEIETHLMGHDEEEREDEGHEHEGEASTTRVFDASHDFSPVSFSTGLVWDFTAGYNFAVSYSYSQRAPSAAELLSFGGHIGARSYEVGALFAIDQQALADDPDEITFMLNPDPIELETSNNIDLSLRKHEGEFGFILNAFYNQVDNYYYQGATGYVAHSSHDHDHGEEEEVGEEEEGGEEEHEHESELPIYLFSSEDAVLYGFEAQAIWQASDALKLEVFSDYVYAKLKEEDRYIPRTPPMRIGARLDFQWDQVTSHLTWTHYADQNNTADLESSTEGYNWLDASINWQLPTANHDLSVFFIIENLTNTEAHVHSSFLKELAPKPARNLRIGLRGSF